MRSHRRGRASSVQTWPPDASAPNGSHKLHARHLDMHAQDERCCLCWVAFLTMQYAYVCTCLLEHGQQTLVRGSQCYRSHVQCYASWWRRTSTAHGVGRGVILATVAIDWATCMPTSNSLHPCTPVLVVHLSANPQYAESAQCTSHPEATNTRTDSSCPCKPVLTFCTTTVATVPGLRTLGVAHQAWEDAALMC